jgi:7-carboxy-7-deazaguanine synthase
MAKYDWSEVFFSVEGEAKFAGHPTAYIRFARCNFSCKGFGNPENLDTTDIKVMGFDPKQYKTLQDLPLITRGCDSIYSWDGKFAHLWHKGDEVDLANQLLDVLPNRSFTYASGKRIICSITGGEPTLRAKTIPTLINSELMKDCNHYLIETNCAVPLKNEFLMDINQWLCADPSRKWTWSNSPKLSSSGESWEDAIRPEIAMKQRLVTGSERSNQVEQYFKFVCEPTEDSFNEVARAMDEYYAAGIPRSVGVYIMPVACQVEDQQLISGTIAKMCMERGYIYCHRVHLDAFGNGVGT